MSLKQAFQEQKQKQLQKKDLSKKGSVDKHIKELVGILNSSENYYTTSSCAGRIVLLLVPESGRKDQSEWIYSTHDQVDLKQVLKVLQTFKHSRKNTKHLKKSMIWFKQESAILHIAARTIGDAEALLAITRKAGFKRSGIITASITASDKKRIIIEIIGTESITAPVAKNCRILADNKYIKALVEEANKKMVKNRKRLKMLEKSITEELTIEENKQ